MSTSLQCLLWLDHHPLAYWCVMAALIGIGLARAVSPLLRGVPDELPRHDWGWSLPVVAILFVGRWPALIFTRELGVDESQLMAGAHALAHDPVFWRAASGGTAGPLDFIALWPVGWIFGWDTYVTARLTATLLLGGALLLAHQCIALLAGRTVARVAVIAVLGIEALTHAADFLHYSTELVPMVLLAGAAYAAVRRWTDCREGESGARGFTPRAQGEHQSLPCNAIWSGLGGLLLGAVPFAKLQPVPMALVMGVTWAWFEWRGPNARRNFAYLMVGALLPATLFAAQLTISGEWTSFLQSYIAFNFQYAGEGRDNFGQAFVVMLGNALWWDNLLPYALLGAAVWAALLVRLRSGANRAWRRLAWCALAGCAMALVCIIAPKRPYLHYWQLLVVPGQLLLGALMGRMLATTFPAWRRREQWLAAGTAIAFTVFLLGHRARYPNLFVGEMAYFSYNARSDLAKHVKARAQSGESLAIWGRADHLYVETGLRQATRDSHVSQLIEPGPLRDYFRERYLTDFVVAKPATVLDSVCPGSVQYNTPQYQHERIFPALAQVIRTHYVLVENFEGARIYRRMDLVGR